MEGDRENEQMRKTKLLTLALCLILLTPALTLAGDFFGLGTFGGRNIEKGYPFWYISDEYEWGTITLSPFYYRSITDKLSLGVEGDIGILDFDKHEDVWFINTSVMGSYDVLTLGKWDIYAEAGGGIGYLPDSPSSDFIGAGLTTNIKYGLGVRVPLSDKKIIRLGYRFMHLCKPWHNDTGANMHGVFMGIEF